MTKELKRTDHERWSVSQPETLFTSPVVNLITSRVHCGRSGTEKDFYRFDFPHWVNVVAVTPQKEIILIRQYRFGTGRTELEIPGSAVNHDEPPLEAGLRELLVTSPGYFLLMFRSIYSSPKTIDRNCNSR